jgi:hypothetical protein
MSVSFVLALASYLLNKQQPGFIRLARKAALHQLDSSKDYDQ